MKMYSLIFLLFLAACGGGQVFSPDDETSSGTSAEDTDGDGIADNEDDDTESDGTDNDPDGLNSGGEVSAIPSVSGTYTMTTVSTASNTCVASFPTGSDFTLIITQDETTLGGTLEGPGFTTAANLSGSVDTDANTYTVSGSVDNTGDQACRYTLTSTITGPADPTGCTTFTKDFTYISGNCNSFFSSGQTSCTAVINVDC